MEPFTELMLPAEPDDVAPDGSRVRKLASLPSGGTAHFELGPGEIASAQRHRTVSEIWFVVAGSGSIWRRSPDGTEREVPLEVGLSLTIPVGTAFQFRAADGDHLDILGVTMPPWPGPDEAEPVDGPWQPTAS